MPIAIIGMGCFFPKSEELKAYWRLILHGEDAITDIPETHWSAEDYFNPDPGTPDHVYAKRGGFLSPVSFDPTEFGIPPSSLDATDTSQLFALMAAKRALEDAGYGADRSFNREKTSIVLGVTGTQELVIPLSSRLGFPIWRRSLEEAGIPPDTVQGIIQRISETYVSWQENSFPGLLGNVVAGRIANRLDLGGTNCVVDAACASSLSALHLAILELDSGRADMVLTGGADTLNDIFMHMCFAQTKALSFTGDARPFSKDADGTVLGEGIGIVVLKRLEDAEKDNDHIYAVIKGLGTSSDGKSQSIYAPNAAGQEKALQQAYEMAGISPATVGLIEAHGTGTRVGDRVEFEALDHFFSLNKAPRQHTALGSIKSMIGHTKAAAGTAGLIKSVLSLYHKVLPPTLKVGEPDDGLDIEGSPFYLNTEVRPWLSTDESPRRAGVSSFGFGGSNFHVVLEEYGRSKADTAWDGSIDIIALSASSPDGLADRIHSLVNRAEKPLTRNEISILAAETRQSFSASYPYRLLMIHDHQKDFSHLLSRGLSLAKKPSSGETENQGNTIYYGGSAKPGKLAYIFPGQGSQYVGMGRDLACLFPEAFQALEEANRAFSAYGNGDCLTDFIYPKSLTIQQRNTDWETKLRQTDIAQPAIGAVSQAMTLLLNSFGLSPDGVCGHSFGELTALWAAGWIDAASFFKLAVYRGKYMAAAGNNNNKGTMLAVHAPLDELDVLVKTSMPGIVLANRNSPVQGVLSGSANDIERAAAVCGNHNIRTTRLSVAAAFHSPLVQDAQKPFKEILETIDVHPTDIPVYANTTGKPYPPEPDKVRRLLGDHLLCPVRFSSEIENLYDQGAATFIELGPRSVLTGLVNTILKGKSFKTIAMDSSSGKQPALLEVAKVLCQLASLGYPVALDKWEDTTDSAAIRKPNMQIPIAGANIKPRPSKEPVKMKPVLNALNQTDNGQPSPDGKKAPPDSVPEHHGRHGQDSLPIHHKQEVSDMANSRDGLSDQALSEALKVFQDGLKSMDILQARTAEAHKLFLETQSEAGRTLQKMMAHAQQMVNRSLVQAEGNMPVFSEGETTDLPVPPVNKPAEKDLMTGLSDTPAADRIEKEDPPVQKPVQKKDAIPAQSPLLVQTLLSVVSDLTGYPTDMLGLDMDIEGDLGIDSIKRVEILSTLEEKMPGLPPVSPDMMGSLKTLGQIVDYLSGTGKEIEKTDPASGIPAIVPSGDSNLNPAESSRGILKKTLLSVVSDLTGYPTDMLGLDMDIEADLGIDSIKRVEILSTLEEKLPGLPPVSPDMMGSLKTLGQIINHLSGESTFIQHTVSPADPDDALLPRPDLNGPDPEDETPKPIVRQSVILTEAPLYQGPPLMFAPGRWVYVTDNGNGLSEAIVKEFTTRGVDAVVMPQYMEAAIKAGRKVKEINEKPAAGLVIVPGGEPKGQTDGFKGDGSVLKDAFLLAKHLKGELNEAAQNGGALLAAISRLDGAFGFKGKGVHRPMLGGLAGLVKTAHLEWEKVCCRAIDLSPDWDGNEAAASSVVSVLLNPDPASPIEIGLDPDVRENFCYRLTLESAPKPENIQKKPNLSTGDLLIVTGGARGITGAAAIALARNFTPRLVLLGRSPSPFPEPEWLIPLEDEREIKAGLIEHEFGGTGISPRAVEERFKAHMANREIHRTLAAIQKTGADVSYLSVDIRNASALASAIQEIRQAHGPIKGIVHGAGVLEDRLIADKTLEQFQSVFDTKVNGLTNLLESTKEDPLTYLILFSSIAARKGNRGQVDYAMANEVLNKTARQVAAQRPDCRVMSINWGPWDGGMVSPALKKEFMGKGISLIPIDQGVECLVQEIAGNNPDQIEVVIGAGIESWGEKQNLQPDAGAPPVQSVGSNGFSLMFKRDIDRVHHPVLESHQLNHRPVVPFALMTEWMGHGALHENPGLVLLGLDDIRLLKGIQLDGKTPTIRLMAGKARKAGAFYEVDVEVRDGLNPDGTDKIHYRAMAVLSENLTPPPDIDKSAFPSPDHYHRSIDEVYQKILFHGKALQGIQKIIGCSSQSMVAILSAAPMPEHWMANPPRSKWIGDPLVLDSAFQMATIWCYEEKNMVSLPSYAASYRQYRRSFPSDGVTAILDILEVTDRKMKGDFTFLDSKDTVVAQMTGYEAVMDPQLMNAFKPSSS